MGNENAIERERKTLEGKKWDNDREMVRDLAKFGYGVIETVGGLSVLVVIELESDNDTAYNLHTGCTETSIFIESVD